MSDLQHFKAPQLSGHNVAPVIIQQEKLADGATLTDEDGGIQTPYFAASESCNSLDTVVPSSMYVEQKKFNERFKAAMAAKGTTVDAWVAAKLHYNSVEELCECFAKEQVDAIATAIWNFENSSDAIIVADQTGVGKGRTAAGLIRYSILELGKTPFFFTEKKHLVNDIYRDLINIKFDAGVPKYFKKTVKVEDVELTDEEILKIIREDIKNTDDVRVEYSFEEDFNVGLILKDIDDSKEEYEIVEGIKAELIELYRQHIVENGLEKEVYEANADYEKQVTEAMREGKHLLTPFVPNRIDIKDTEGNILYPAIPKKEIDAIYKLKNGKEDSTLKASDFELPEKYKLFAMPYSQIGTGFYDFNGKKLKKSKIKLFEKYADGSVIILDESHNASGMNAQGELSNTGEIIYRIVKDSAMTTYLSATYAKRADNMPLYALRTSIRESGLSDSEMITAFREGGNSLQEAVSAELTRNGQLLRREKIIQGKSEYYYENDKSEIGLNQISKLNKIADLYKQVKDFSVAVNTIIKDYKKTKSTEEAAKYKRAAGVNRLAFQLFNFMLLGLKVRQTTELALKNLRSGKKTVITVANTMESALDNLSKTFMSKKDSDSYKLGDEIKNDFSLYMGYLLMYTMKYNYTEEIVNDDGTKEVKAQVINVLDSDDELSERIKDALMGEYETILKSILDAVTGIPIAPIDMIKSIIKENGFKINEITGRQRNIVFENGNYEKGTIQKREVKKTDIVVREFNENDIDCLIINQSGATGISMHAMPNRKANKVYKATKNDDGTETENAPKTLENAKEVKKRAMIITQMELDINKEVQKLGRINRTGQVYQPEYTYIISAIPSESRLTSLMEKKLRSLSANVSSNQEQASYLFTSDDFFSNVAVEPFNQTMIDVGMRQVSVSRGSQIQDFTKTMYFQPYELQRDFYKTFSDRLTKEIETLTAQGLYTGKMTSKDYFATTKSQYPFFIGDNNARTSFGRHSFIEKTSVTLYKEKNTERSIATAITDKMYIKDGTTDGGNFFTKLPEFQLKASEKLSEFASEKEKAVLSTIKDIDEKIAGITTFLNAEKTKLSAYSKLEEGLALEEKLKNANDAISEGSKKITDLIMSGDMESVQTLTKEIQAHQVEKKALEAKLVNFAEVLSNKGAHKEITRAIKDFEYDIERYAKRRDSAKENLQEYVKNVMLAKEYINKIGSMQQLDVFEENIKYNDNYETSGVEYKTKLSEPVVITGISFPAFWMDFTAGSFDIHMSGITEKYTYSMYSFNKTFTEEKTNLGFKPLNALSFLQSDYKGKWNEIAGKIDNSYREDRYIIIGSLLRTFTLANNNGITGQIIKYNTEDNKVRIGIEIADNKNLKDGQKSVYKILESRYDSETNLNYPVYYDGNIDNINRYITDYMYEYLVESLYGSMEKKIKYEDARNALPDMVWNPNSYPFLFQISSSEKGIWMVIRPNRALADYIRDDVQAYREDRDRSNNKVSKEKFLESLEVSIISNAVISTDALAYKMKQKLGIEITNENYSVSKKSVFQEIEPRRYSGGRLGVNRMNGTIFKNIFPTNIIDFEQFASYGFEYVSELKMSYDTLIKLFAELEKDRRKPTFATSSQYFDRFKNEYVFEQFQEEAPMEVSAVREIPFESKFFKEETTEEREPTEAEIQEEWQNLFDACEIMLADTSTLSEEEKTEWENLYESAKIMLGN